MPPRAGEQVVNAVDMLQDRLGIDEEHARDLANIEVACPVPGEDRQASLGEFMASEHGVDHADQIVDTAAHAVEAGVGVEEAMSRALGFAAVRTEDGSLARVTAEEPVPARESKKK